MKSRRLQDPDALRWPQCARTAGRKEHDSEGKVSVERSCIFAASSFVRSEAGSRGPHRPPCLSPHPGSKCLTPGWGGQLFLQTPTGVRATQTEGDSRSESSAVGLLTLLPTERSRGPAPSFKPGPILPARVPAAQDTHVSPGRPDAPHSAGFLQHLSLLPSRYKVRSTSSPERTRTLLRELPASFRWSQAAECRARQES